MLRKNKQIIFFTLFLLFTIYTYLVYTSTPINNVGHLSAKSQEGQLVFQKYNCISCHQIYGLGGYMGPDLTNVISTKGKEYAKAFISNGTNKMPNFKMTGIEIESLVSFLEDVSKSGVSQEREFTINNDGTVTINTTK